MHKHRFFTMRPDCLYEPGVNLLWWRGVGVYGIKEEARFR